MSPFLVPAAISACSCASLGRNAFEATPRLLLRRLARGEATRQSDEISYVGVTRFGGRGDQERELRAKGL
jgi:hypothetical protein